MTRAGLVVLLAVLLASCRASVGDACSTHGACRDGLEHGYCAKAGICTRACGPQTPTEPLSGATVEDTRCPEGSACLRRGARFVCLPTCTKDGDCAPGLSCSGEGVCELLQPFIPAAGR